VKNLALLLAAAVVLSAPAYAQSAAKLTEAVRNADLGWEKVFSARNLDASVDYIAKDGAMLPPNAPIATGQDEVRKFISDLFALKNLNVSWQPDTVEVANSGDLAFTAGTYQMAWDDAQDNSHTDRGKYVTVWKKQADDSWKVLRDIFNSDLPVKP
jgi:ketosteroid isomerase-like protein